MECDKFVSATAYFYDVLGIMQRIALKLNKPQYARFLLDERKKLGDSFNQQFLKNIGPSGALWYGSQTATVMALQFGIVPDSLIKNVSDGLKYDIVVTKSGHHDTGIHGNRYIYMVLDDLGEEQLSYKILTNPDFPSQAYILNCGLTTWPERQWPWGSDIEWNRSLNHPMQAGFAAYFYESVAGIRPMADFPGFKEFMIQPAFLKELKYANTSINTPYGKITVNWNRKGQSIAINVVVPFNTKAHLKLPASDLSKIEINRKSKEKIISKSGEVNRNNKEMIIGPGKYCIRFDN